EPRSNAGAIGIGSFSGRIRVWKPMSQARGILHDFHDLMGERIDEILLVASPYDAFTLEEGGRVNELILRESVEPPPRVTAAATGAEALEWLATPGGARLVVTA